MTQFACLDAVLVCRQSNTDDTTIVYVPEPATELFLHDLEQYMLSMNNKV